MRILCFVIPSAFALALGTACGGSSESGPDASTVAPSESDASVASPTEVATYQQLALKVQDAAATYRNTMTAPGISTVADCQRVHDAYYAQVRPWVSQMVGMSGAMDRYMDDHGGAGVADYGCVSSTTQYEFDRHHAAACASADVAADQAEVTRHVDAMRSYSGHMWDRCEQMMHGAGANSWNWGPMMGGCENWDGCCSGMMHDCCGGWDGMMMGGMHHSCCDR